MSSEENKKNKSFVGGAVILGLAGLLVKVLGAAFRIPLANIIGDDGMGYYQTAYPIYVLFLTLATAGIPTAISRMVAERYALDKPKAAYKVFRVSSLLLFLTGLVSAGILYFGAGAVTRMIKEPDAVYAMQALAIGLIFIPLMGSYRGFFQGRQNMRPTAVSQFVEQLFRVAAGLGLAIYFLPKGLPFAAAGASFGATAGGIFGFICIALIYLANRRTINAELRLDNSKDEESIKSILWTILTIAVPITIGSSVMPIINSIDTAMVKTRLISIGYDSDSARALYGQLTGMAAPIINLPQVFTQAVSMSLVPVVASAFKRGETDFMRKNISLGLRYAMLIATPCAFGMMALAKPIMLLLYPRQQASAQSAAACLAILAMGVIFLSLVHATTGTLQGIGKQHLPVIDLCFGALFKIGVNYFLTAVPALNVKGAAIGTASAYLVAAVMNLWHVSRFTGTKYDYVAIFIKPAIAAGCMGAAARLSYELFHRFAGNMISTMLAIAVGVIAYVILVFATRSITLDELETIPKGKRIAGILRRFIK